MQCQNENCDTGDFVVPVAVKRRGCRTERLNLCVGHFKQLRREHRGKSRVIVDYHREAIADAVRSTNGNGPTGGRRHSQS
jgi:hypothetical protein